MLDLWIRQAMHLSIGQSVTLLSLSVALIGLVLAYKSMEGKDDV